MHFSQSPSDYIGSAVAGVAPYAGLNVSCSCAPPSALLPCDPTHPSGHCRLNGWVRSSELCTFAVKCRKADTSYTQRQAVPRDKWYPETSGFHKEPSTAQTETCGVQVETSTLLAHDDAVFGLIGHLQFGPHRGYHEQRNGHQRYGREHPERRIDVPRLCDRSRDPVAKGSPHPAHSCTGTYTGDSMR